IFAIAAIARDAERAHGRAIVLAPLAAGAAILAQATDPWVDQHRPADLDPLALRLGAERDDFAQDLMAKRQRQLHARAHIEPAFGAEIEITIRDVQVRMADAR